MKYTHLAFIVLTAVLMTACASHKTKTETTESTPTEKAIPAKEAPKKENAASVQGEIIGKPARGSKFSKLKIGMTLNQVVKLIGPPTKQWTHPTGKMGIPFYFGPDRIAIQYSYKGEGLLTLNYGEEQLLTRIEVNKAE